MKTSLLLLALSLATLTSATGCSSAEDGVATASDALNDAEQQTTPVTLTNLSYAGGTLEFGYTMSGGCAEHTPAVKLRDLVDRKDWPFDRQGRLEVLDVSAPDPCEALISVQGTAKLGELLKSTEPGAPSAALTLPTVGLELTEAPSRVAPQPTGAGFPMTLTAASLERSGDFTFAYSTSGGCAEHAPKVSVELRPSTSFVFSHTAKVVVSDVTSTPDSCEAMIQVEGRANLVALIRAEAERTGVDVRAVEVELPALQVFQH